MSPLKTRNKDVKRWRKSNAALIAYYTMEKTMEDALSDCCVEYKTNVSLELKGEIVYVDFLLPASEQNSLVKPLAIMVLMPHAGVSKRLRSDIKGNNYLNKVKGLLQGSGYIVRCINADQICFDSLWGMLEEISPTDT